MTHDPKPMTSSLARYWLLLGVTALAIAGLFSLVLVIARTPSLSNLPLFAELFHKSLVVHVDLSVLVWFLAIACMMWSLLAEGSRSVFPLLEEGALISFALGMVCLMLSPLDGKAAALMSNYIPVITSPVFFLGLSLLMCGVMLMLVKVLTTGHPRGRQAPPGILCNWIKIPASPMAREDDIISYAVYCGALIAAIAVMAFIWSYRGLAHDFDPQQYYELLFWGGGHTLQFLHVQMVMVCWLLLAHNCPPPLRGRVGWGVCHKLLSKWLPPSLTLPLKGGGNFLSLLFSIGLAASLVVPLIYMFYEVNSVEHRSYFTQMMILGGGTAPTILALLLLRPLWRGRIKNALWSSLCMSLLLFIYGGLLGGMIQGQNVVIPAHYHGSIVGVTLAFMGAAYLYLPVFGYRDVAQWRLAFWQPIIYGGGQLMHISGLAWSGGYGVLRKTPGGMDALSTGVKAAMGFMGLGGLIAIIGGFMFVIVVWKSVKR